MAQIFGVAVKGIIRNPENKYLILFKSDQEDVNPNDFDIPGGRINRGEKLEDALTREIQEETGLEVRIEKLSNTRGFTKGEMHLVGITFLVYCEHAEHIVLSQEHNGFRRMTKEEIVNGNLPNRIKEEFSSL